MPGVEARRARKRRDWKGLLRRPASHTHAFLLHPEVLC